ncbi:hypothetical protein KEM60_00273 [Austwickia sp. TVS 96-490-7B]|uniref:tryptophan-rich sensory protein n=1 Tax=Austwickia sp. TVS 96-490-7B TaxID=2830843 RepID=UPI001C570D1E|nr:tryptophan-rich sensory protein [Austwickia sp. TVS 96-490-7B]MBW3084090.1 hypothetical protein [Austwickia sp. TVS 96-490-7B]
MSRTALVTGASGYVGGRLVPELLARGWSVRVLARTPSRLAAQWRDQVEVVQGDLGDEDCLDEAMAGVDVAWYLVHSMDGQGDYAARDRRLAQGFAAAAERAGISRIVYLSGLHPRGVELSEHLASRVEVGEVFLGCAVPSVVVQAGVVLGAGSASYRMLRHLTERLPVAVGPRWLRNRIQPIAVDDVVFFLAAAAEVDSSVNRTVDVGMAEVLTYAQMMSRYAQVNGLMRRRMGIVPVLTPGLASHWVGLVTPVPSGVAKPLVGSLINDAVAHEDDAAHVLGVPPGGVMGYDEAVRAASSSYDPRRWGRTAWRVGAGVAACAAVGSLLTQPDSSWYRELRKPSWQPPPVAFPVVWTTLYAVIWVASTSAACELAEDGPGGSSTPQGARASRRFTQALAANLALNAAWSGVFFRARALPAAAVTAGALTVSAADLARRAAPTGWGKAAGLGVYAGWSAFATVLSTRLAMVNRSKR